MIDLLAYVATGVLLAMYALDKHGFDVANAFLFPFIGISAIQHHAWPSLIITVSFGLIGAWNASNE